MNETTHLENVDAPAGTEGFRSNVQLAKRLLCTPTHAARLLASRELTPRRLGKSLVYYAAADLDRVRGRMFGALLEKTSELTAGERERLRSGFAFSAARAGEPDLGSTAAASDSAGDESRRAGLAEISRRLDVLQTLITADAQKFAALGAQIVAALKLRGGI